MSSVVLAHRGDVALIVARTVEPGHERPFQEWARGILAAAATMDGYLGGGLFHPAADGDPWIIVHRFKNQHALRAWLDSPRRARFFDNSAGHRHTEVARRELTGMETWFADLNPAAAAPPRWKMAAGSAIGIFPISLLGSAILAPHLTALPLVLRTAVFAVLFSVLMTYVSMPLVTRALRRWLRPAHPKINPTRRFP
ncbi:antibiotic biosynthesis monooxygenase [Nocardia sp. NPDC051756]|uniref:antibiotic biosynthesis monooxygenase n=1 Tax=Nocardia sp. NPDC051756 TaxID=3154751 RepID=UPI00342B26FC